jgi:cellulose synthase/poly-beta-1,6-N-acetylglucosamine synthase-like glycosyltransferase
MTTIIIPVKNPKHLNEFIIQNKAILDYYPVIIIDSGGGLKLSAIKSRLYYFRDVDFPTARKLGGQLSFTKYCLHLDCDAVLPENYINEAEKILDNNPEVAVVSIEYENLKGHLGFGTSLWRTKIFNELYDFTIEYIDFGICECLYMWRKVLEHGYKIETLNCRAKHLRDEK